MKKLANTNIKVTRYEHGDYYIDIVEMEEEFEAWLQDKTMGVSLHMFGLTKEGHEVGEFIYVVEQFVDDYENAYREEVY